MGIGDCAPRMSSMLNICVRVLAFFLLSAAGSAVMSLPYLTIKQAQTAWQTGHSLSDRLWAFTSQDDRRQAIGRAIGDRGRWYSDRRMATSRGPPYRPHSLTWAKAAPYIAGFRGISGA